MSKYRVEYTKKGIPGILYKWPTTTRELLEVLFELWARSENIEIYRN